MSSTAPRIDAGARQRLTTRFGSEVAAWFDQLPAVLTDLAERWQFEFGNPIPRGSVSTVFRCQMADGRPAVLRASPGPCTLGVRGGRARRLGHGSHPRGDRARPTTRGTSDRGDRARHAARSLISLPGTESIAELLTALHGRRRSRSVLPDGRAAHRVPVRLLGETLRTSPRAHDIHSAGRLRARAPARADSVPDRPVAWRPHARQRP